jgi:hypothetical protein
VHGHGSLKTAPKGYPKDHPRSDLLRHKGLTTWKDWPPAAWLGTAAAKNRIVEFLRPAGHSGSGWTTTWGRPRFHVDAQRGITRVRLLRAGRRSGRVPGRG